MKDVNLRGYNSSVTIKADRINSNLERAKRMLGEEIMADCTPFVPRREGILRGSARMQPDENGGEISWNTPYAHFQYQGYVYIGVNSKSAFAALGEPKEKTDKRLTYAEPGTGAGWFDKTKEKKITKWIGNFQENLK